MELNFFLKGVIIGFSIAAPVGPIGILCIQKTLRFGRLSGLFSGLGAAAADTLYGIVAAFGLTFVSSVLLAGAFWFRLFGGIFLIVLGLKTFFAKPVVKPGLVSHKTLLGDFVSTFFLTLTNPLTIIAYLAVFAGLGLSESINHYEDSTMLIMGVFLGSALWWLILSEGITFFRKKVSQEMMTAINKIAGALIVAFGVFALLSLTIR